MKIECLDHAERLEKTVAIETDTLIVMPATNKEQALRAAALMASRSYSPGTIVIVIDEAKEGFIRLSNRAFRASESRFYGYVAQDVFPGRGWLKLAITHLENTERGLLAFNDGKWHGLLASYGLTRRAWAQNNYDGDLFYPEYQRHWADTELSMLAKHEQQFLYDASSVLIEIDWQKDGQETHAADRRLFRARRKTGFDGRTPNEAHPALEISASGLP